MTIVIEEVHMLYDAFRIAYNHAKKGIPLEIGGFLLGYVGRWKGRYYLLITHALPVPSKSTRVTVQLLSSNVAEIVGKIRAIQRETGAYVVGWYHSHPGYTCKPSRLDLKSHTTYFREPYQVGLIIDPVNEEHCVFNAENALSYWLIPFYVWRKKEGAGR